VASEVRRAAGDCAPAEQHNRARGGRPSPTRGMDTARAEIVAPDRRGAQQRQPLPEAASRSVARTPPRGRLRWSRPSAASPSSTGREHTLAAWSVAGRQSPRARRTSMLFHVKRFNDDAGLDISCTARCACKRALRTARGMELPCAPSAPSITPRGKRQPRRMFHVKRLIAEHRRFRSALRRGARTPATRCARVQTQLARRSSGLDTRADAACKPRRHRQAADVGTHIHRSRTREASAPSRRPRVNREMDYAQRPTPRQLPAVRLTPNHGMRAGLVALWYAHGRASPYTAHRRSGRGAIHCELRASVRW
jgi:hypothetical protein